MGKICLVAMTSIWFQVCGGAGGCSSRGWVMGCEFSREVFSGGSMVGLGFPKATGTGFRVLTPRLLGMCD